MPPFIRLLIFALLLGIGAFLNGATDKQASAVQSCDPSYPYVCLPPGLSITCLDIGAPIVVIYAPNLGAYDPYILDPDFDGVGCEDF